MSKVRSNNSAQSLEEIAARVAQEQQLELVEVALQKESRGKCLCIYVDKEDGISLDDCERYHKAIQPLLESVDYDFLEVSSPGVDRPIKTRRDFEKNRDGLVELRLFAPVDGVKICQGYLTDWNDEQVTLTMEDGATRAYPRKAVALLKPVVIFEDDEEE